MNIERSVRMNEKIRKLLEDREENHIFPFFWQHGETESVLRKYMHVIRNSNVKAVCIESRPHPDFCGPGWWHDMDIILDEAEKLGMQVWILDDSHFPTGYCNGAVEKKSLSMRRQFLTYRILGEVTAGAQLTWEKEEYRSVLPFQPSGVEEYFHLTFEQFPDDRWIGAVAVKKDGDNFDDLIPLREEDGKLMFTATEGTWKVYSCQLTRNRGPHRSYMNMLDRESCRTLIDVVYESHYRHYKDRFGTTIAGFFSDEPEIGNGHLYEMDRKIFENPDQPWSLELEMCLKEEWGEDYYRYLPLLWEQDFDRGMTARVRFCFMDHVTRLVEKNFSQQVGVWCREHGVEYIGHLIEDNNQHARCGSSLGHYFRGLSGQDMAGIDDIGGQVIPQGEDIKYVSHLGTERDGVFYHFTLGRLASSAAAIDFRKKGRSMCEIFGNYGWQEGVRLESYLADHFMVRGVNHFVPHAFSAKAFPDPDCPPHFYAHGHNPQYRHFGVLMKYMNRVCTLISGGTHESEAAILYHGDAEWTGMKCMYIQEPARILTENQIGFDFVPSDIFTDACYMTKLEGGLTVNKQTYQVLIIPEADYITKETAKAAVVLGEQGFLCIFLNNYPVGICNEPDQDEEQKLLEKLVRCTRKVDLERLAGYLAEHGNWTARISPAEPYIRSFIYHGDTDILYMINEGTCVYEGEVIVKTGYDSCCRYNAWENTLEKAEASVTAEGMCIQVRVEPGKSFIIVFGVTSELEGIERRTGMQNRAELRDDWKRSVSSSIEYPAFHGAKTVSLPDRVEEDIPDFAGCVRYEKVMDIDEIPGYGTPDEKGKVFLEITDAGEAVQLFVNGSDLGIQIVPPFRYEISRKIVKGKNQIVIEVATTLERQIPPKNRKPDWKPGNICGLHGKVYLIY